MIVKNILIREINSLEGVNMKNKEEVINTTWRKMPYVWSVCICLLFIIYLRNKLIALLKSYPHDKLSDFIWQYIQSNNHQILIIIVLIAIIITISMVSIFLLIKGIGHEEKLGKILNSILILFNIAVIITTLLSNLIVFKIIIFMIFSGIIILALVASLGNNSNN